LSHIPSPQHAFSCNVIGCVWKQGKAGSQKEFKILPSTLIFFFLKKMLRRLDVL
jgi:hypothetical protein